MAARCNSHCQRVKIFQVIRPIRNTAPHGRNRRAGNEGEEKLAAEVGKKYVIIGNGIAGTTCAQMLRKNDVSCDIWLITNEPHPLYNRVSLPRYLQGLLPEQKVMIRDFAWHEQQHITLLTETLVTRSIPMSAWSTSTTAARYPTMRCWWRRAAGPTSCDVPGVAGTQYIFNFVTLDDTREIIARALESKEAVTSRRQLHRL